MPNKRKMISREGPIGRLCLLCREWETSLHQAASGTASLAATPNAIGPGILAEQIRTRIQPEFERLRGEILLLAQGTAWQERLFDLINRTAKDIEAVERWSTASVREILAYGSRTGDADPLATARESLRQAIAALGQYKSVLRQELPRAPLTTRQLKIWDLLKKCALSAEEVRARIDAADEDAVRREILKMREMGWPIKHRRGRGYYRDDAPPPDLLPS